LGRLFSLSTACTCVALASMLAAACGGDGTPTRPTPTPDPLTLTCPAPVALPSPTAQPIAVRYGSATTAGGSPPVQVTCAPGSDTLFPVGRSTVTCTASDTRGITASCSFSVTVTAPPTISLTQYLAFGDSMTAGEITVIGEGGLHVLQLFPNLAYPADLRTLLANRYTAQTIGVANAGVKGELTSQGLARLPSSIFGQQVLLLMEGANDINSGRDADVLTALSNIRSMVRFAKGAGLRVFLATLPPQNPTGCFNPCRTGGAAEVVNYNSGLKTIALSENVPLVDVFPLFTNLSTQIGPDGLHPTAEGYQLIANAFFAAIRSALEVPASSLAPLSLHPPIAAPSRRR
jgi:lysophospholipase L1-like esterase